MAIVVALQLIFQESVSVLAHLCSEPVFAGINPALQGPFDTVLQSCLIRGVILMADPLPVARARQRTDKLP